MATLVKVQDGDTGAEAADKLFNNDTELAARIAAVSAVPPGGSTGQVLKKTSGADGATAWGSLPSPPDLSPYALEAEVIKSGAGSTPENQNVDSNFGVRGILDVDFDAALVRIGDGQIVGGSHNGVWFYAGDDGNETLIQGNDKPITLSSGDGTTSDELKVAGANIVRESDGKKVLFEGDATGGSIADPTTAQLSLMNTIKSAHYGDSITTGFLNDGTVYSNYPKRFTQRAGLPYGAAAIRAYPAQGVFYAAQQMALYNPKDNQDTAITWMAGLNDVRVTGDTAKTRAKIATLLRTFIGYAFTKFTRPALYTTAVTGVWSDFDTAPMGGIAQYLGGTNKGVSASAIGASLEWELQPYDGETLIIHTLSSDGQLANKLGAFDILIDDTLVGHYNPENLNDGVQTTGAGDFIGRMQNAIFIKGAGGSHIKIVTTSADLTVIDAWGWMNSPQKCPPVFISGIPKLTAAGYLVDNAYGTSLASNAIIDAYNEEVIKPVVAEFKGYPITYVDINSVYDAVNTVDGIHPNKKGHLQMSVAFSDRVLGAIAPPFVNPLIDGVFAGVTVGQGNAANSYNISNAALGADALRNNTSGSSNVGVGQDALKQMTGGGGNVGVGTNALKTQNGRDFNTGVGANAGNGANGNNNTMLGAGALPADVNSSNNVVLSDGAGRTVFEVNAAGDVTLATMAGVAGVAVASTHKIPMYVKIGGVRTLVYLLASDV